MSENDFVKNLEITIDDLNYTKNNGLVKGITDVMVRGLKELDIYKRPIHCTDAKRETVYIKDEEKWEKDENNEKMKEVIIDIANKERESVYKWKNENRSIIFPIKIFLMLLEIRGHKKVEDTTGIQDLQMQ